MNISELDRILKYAGVSVQLNEARIPGVEYVESKTKGVISKVTAKMSSYMGGSWTRLNTRYMKLEFQLKRLDEAKKKLNLDITDKIQSETFDPEDEILTRVVETNDAVFTLSKRTMRQKADKVDRKAIIDNLPEELKERVDFLTGDMLPELTKAIELIVEKYTTTFEPEEVKPALRPRRKTKFKQFGESNNEELTESFFSDRFKQLFSKFFTQYDKKLEYIKNI